MSDKLPNSLVGSRLDAIATQWSLVRNAHATGTPNSATVARQALVLRYAKAIRRYIGGMTRQHDDADELAQDAIMRLMKGDFAGADPNRGRFRDLLKVAIRNMVHNHWAKSNRRRAGDANLDVLPAADDDETWDREWRQMVLDHAWDALHSYEETHPLPPTYTLLRLRADHPDASSEQLAELLSTKIRTPVRADACRQQLRRARQRFAEALVAELQSGLADTSPDRLTEELAALGLLEYVRDFVDDPNGG